MVSNWLGCSNCWVTYLGWVTCLGWVEPLDAGSKVLPMPYLIQRKLLTFVRTLFTVYFSLNTPNNNCLRFIGFTMPNPRSP